MFAASDAIKNLPTRRVANAITRVALAEGNAILGRKVPYNSTTNTLTDQGREMIQTGIYKALSTRFREHIQNSQDADGDTGLVQVNPNVTVTGGNLIAVEVRVAPEVFGYVLNLSVILAVKE
jgi:hypothetical protein